MASLRYSAADESEDTLNSFTSHTSATRLFVHREKGLFLSENVDDFKLAGKKQNITSMWKVLNKEVDLGQPTSFLDHVYLGCTQRQ